MNNSRSTFDSDLELMNFHKITDLCMYVVSISCTEAKLVLKKSLAFCLKKKSKWGQKSVTLEVAIKVARSLTSDEMSPESFKNMARDF